MEKDLVIGINSEFRFLEFESEAECWYFIFDKIVFNIDGIWRILIEKKIKFVSLDNKQLFGLTKPIDLVQEINKLLKGKLLLEVKVKQFSSDLILTFTDNIQIEIFISSSGYETYSFEIDNKRYIGMGSGNLSIHDNI